MMLGVDIGGTKCSVCLGDAEGNIRATRRIPTRSEAGPEEGLRRVLDLARQLLEENGLSFENVERIGLSAPGPVSLARGLMLEPPNMKGWVNVPLPMIFTEATGCKVVMNNDANACALAEWLWGACRGANDLVFVTLSTGLGAGVIANRQLVQGATDTAGEVGHHVLDIHGPPCPCGQRGCWEIYCGGMNVANRIRDRIRNDGRTTRILELAGQYPDRIDFRIFLDAVRQQDPFALECWEEFVERLAQGLGNLIMILNPQVILLGTIAIHAGDLLLESVRERLPRYCWRPGRDACQILPSTLGERIGDLSALALAAHSLQTENS